MGKFQLGHKGGPGKPKGSKNLATIQRELNLAERFTQEHDGNDFMTELRKMENLGPKYKLAIMLALIPYFYSKKPIALEVNKSEALPTQDAIEAARNDFRAANEVLCEVIDVPKPNN